MKHFKLITGFVLIVFFSIFLMSGPAEANQQYYSVQNHLVRWFEFKEDPFLIDDIEVNLKSKQKLDGFYRQRSFDPIWTTDEGLEDFSRDFIELLKKSSEKGLFPAEYYVEEIDLLISELFNTNDDYYKAQLLTRLDLMLTDSFFVYLTDILSGRIDREEEKRVWLKDDLNINLKKILNEVYVEQDIENIFPINENLDIRIPEYKIILENLSLYQQAQNGGGWSNISGGDILRSGDRGERVKQLRERLQNEPGQWLSLESDNPDYFDQELQRAVFNFQQKHGLLLTGQVGENTLQALNKTAEEIIKTMKINLERIRWLYQNAQETYIIANSPSFSMQFVHRGEEVTRERTIIGKKNRPTPVFSSYITSIVFNPRWYIPESIAVNDYLPHVKEDISYLEERNVKVYQETDSGFQEVNPEEIDWEEQYENELEYYFWQEAGPWNALGDVIFQSPNNYHVYMHDTPEQYLFENQIRSFSSGCVRVQNAINLAEYFVEHFAEQEWEEIQEIRNENNETVINLQERIPLHFTYFSVWVSAGDQIRIYDDVYEKDEYLKEIYFNQ